MHTTLNEIRKHSPCEPSWAKLLKSLGKTSADDEPLEFRTIYEVLGAYDMLWCTITLDKKSRVYLGAKFAETTLKYTTDERVHDCVKACFLYAEGKATDEELVAAGSVAGDAAWSTRSAAGWAARYAARYAARDVALYAAGDAWDAAWSAALEIFAQMMLEYVEQE